MPSLHITEKDLDFLIALNTKLYGNKDFEEESRRLLYLNEYLIRQRDIQERRLTNA